MKPSSDERLNKQAGPGTKGLPLRDMWQRTPPPPLQLPIHRALLLEPRGTIPHTPECRSQEEGEWRVVVVVEGVQF